METIIRELYTFTNELQSDGFTISKLLPTKRTIEFGYNEKNFKYLNDLKLDLLKEIYNRFKYREEDNTRRIAAFADPNYGVIWNLSPLEEKNDWNA